MRLSDARSNLLSIRALAAALGIRGRRGCVVRLLLRLGALLLRAPNNTAWPRPKLLVSALRRAFAIMLAVELLYLIMANALFRTSLVSQVVQSAQGIRFDYGSAYSVVPGRVHVDRLKLRFEDYNVQFELRIDHAVLDVSLHELALRRFHVLDVRAGQVSFRMRHKLHSVGQDAMRVASYPKIEGFADPPLYTGSRPPPIPDAQYHLWQVHIENVLADVNEIWILEYRFLGNAIAAGSFLLKPARWVMVKSASLTFQSGKLQTVESGATGALVGRIRCDVPGLDVRRLSGSEIFRAISADATLSIANWELKFIDQYLQPRFKVDAKGPLEVQLRAELSAGRITERTNVVLDAPKTVATSPDGSFEGRVHATLGAVTATESLTLQLKISDATLAASNPRMSVMDVSRLDSHVAVKGLDLSQPMVFDAGNLSLHAQSRYSTWTRLLGASARPTRPELLAAIRCDYRQKSNSDGEGECDVRMPPSAPAAAALATSTTMQARFHTGKAPRWFAQGALSVQVSGADKLIERTGFETLSHVPHFLLPETLDSTVAFHVSGSRQLFQVTHAKSGDFHARGFLLRNASHQNAAILLTSGAISLGIAVENDDVSLAPLVTDAWLRERGREFGLRPD